MFDKLPARFKQTLRGTVQCRLAENIASGPSFLNGSSICDRDVRKNDYYLMIDQGQCVRFRLIYLIGREIRISQ